MKNFVHGIILFFLFGSFVSAQPIPLDSIYLGQIPPGNIPEIFHLSVTPEFFAAERITISNDNKEIYYSELKGYYPINSPKIKNYSYSSNNWTGPFNLFDSYVGPSLSVTGDTMYFEGENSQTYLSSKNGSTWSNPKRMLSELNKAHYLQVTNKGNYYVSSIPGTGIGASDWCKLVFNGNDTTAVSLGLPLNSSGDNLDFFVSRNEQFMIVSKPGGLCVSYQKTDGGWTNPKNLGSKINFGLGMWGPYATSDNKYLFYTTGTNPDYSDTHIYWVRVDVLLDSLRQTNFVPYVKTPIPNQTVTVEHSYNYTIPDSTFFDDDGNSTLIYSAKLNNGSPLPSWLIFDSVTRTFSGIPTTAGFSRIKVTATDTANASISIAFSITAQPVPADSLYLGQTPPGNSAIIFAPGFISLPDRRETKIVFSPNEQECLIGTGSNNTFTILYSNYYNGYWSAPVPANFISNDRSIEPFFSPDSLHLFFTSYADIYSSARVNRTWTTPVKLNSPINTDYEEYHPTATSGGTLYFCSMRENARGDIFRSYNENGNYPAVEKLGIPINRHDSLQDGAYDPFIAPDESYIIFTCVRPDGFGQEDQYISYNRNGIWTNPKNLGPSINTDKIEYGSYISPDNKYYFFSRPSGWGPNSPADIYWIKIDGLIDSLRYTNFVPYLKKSIPDQNDSVGYSFYFSIPDRTFIDDDGNNTLTYDVKLTNGNPLPDWLAFDTITSVFSGIPTNTEILNVLVTATDSAGASVTTQFNITITNPNSIDQKKEQGIIIYPNPTNGIINVSLKTSSGSNAIVEIINLEGKVIASKTFSKETEIDVAETPKGIYFVKLFVDDEIIVRKVFVEKNK
jgi:hypothetical protein